MRTSLSLGISSLCLAASAMAAPRHDLACKATHTMECVGPTCENAGPGQGEDGASSIPIELTLATASGVGELCTYTYCRKFMLVPNPGETVQRAVNTWTGFTLSEKSGSVGEDSHRPSIDYQLSLSEDRSRFFLGNIGNGGFSGWAGACAPYQPIKD